MKKMKNPTIYNDIRFCINYLEPEVHANPRQRRGVGPSGYSGGFTIELADTRCSSMKAVIVINRGDRFNHRDMEALTFYCIKRAHD